MLLGMVTGGDMRDWALFCVMARCEAFVWEGARFGIAGPSVDESLPFCPRLPI